MAPAGRLADAHSLCSPLRLLTTTTGRASHPRRPSLLARSRHPRAGRGRQRTADERRNNRQHRPDGRAPQARCPVVCGPASAPAPSPPFHTHRRCPGRPAGAQGCGARPQPHVRARARALVLSDRPHAFRWRDFSRRNARATRPGGHPIRVYFSHRGIHLKPGLDSTCNGCNSGRVSMEPLSGSE